MNRPDNYYQHHWQRPPVLDRERFALLLADLAALAPHVGCELSYGTEDGPCLGPELIAFNDGLEEEDEKGDDFLLERDVSGLDPSLYEEDGLYADYCETQGLPYDRFVRLTLVALSVRFPEATVWPGADLRGWVKAYRAYAQIILGGRLKIYERKNLRAFAALGGGRAAPAET